jgi:hypothetical protein
MMPPRRLRRTVVSDTFLTSFRAENWRVQVSTCNIIQACPGDIMLQCVETTLFRKKFIRALHPDKEVARPSTPAPTAGRAVTHQHRGHKQKQKEDGQRPPGLG